MVARAFHVYIWLWFNSRNIICVKFNTRWNYMGQVSTHVWNMGAGAKCTMSPVGGCCPCTWVCFALQKHLDTRKIPLRTSSKHQRSHLNKFKKRWYKPLPPVRFGLLVIIYIHPLEYIYKYIHIYIYTSAGIYLYVFGVGQKHFLRTRSHCCS